MKGGTAARFGGFAAGHILWSFLCSWPMLRLLDGPQIAAKVGTAVMMLGYALAGWIVARGCRWPIPTKKQGLAAVFFPAGIAWLWAGTTAALLMTEAVGVAAVLGLPAFWLAAPSLLFMMTFVPLFGMIGLVENLFPWVFAGIFAAGLLPPLLFFLGSLWYSNTACKKAPEAA